MALSMHDILHSCKIIFCVFLHMILTTAKEKFEPDSIKVSDAFDVKPGNSEQVYKDSWDDFFCKFTYIAQGGTKEQWAMSFTRSKDKREFSCHVERPDGASYLFFQKFHLEIGDRDYDLVEAETEPASDGSGPIYVQDIKSKSIYNRDGYMGSLTKIEAHAIRGREEL